MADLLSLCSLAYCGVHVNQLTDTPAWGDECLVFQGTSAFFFFFNTLRNTFHYFDFFPLIYKKQNLPNCLVSAAGTPQRLSEFSLD